MGRREISGVTHNRPVSVSSALIGSDEPKTHLYLAPGGRAGNVLIVKRTLVVF